MPRKLTHHQAHMRLYETRPITPTDYTDHGGEIERWADTSKSYPDCSVGCKHAAWLEGPLGSDWCICLRPDGPRFGLLTFEKHQAGYGCFEPGRE